MSATQDYVALEWIRGELANTLESAQFALEAVAESPDDTSSMRACLSAIHQVHGTLKMVQLEGPTIMAAEMEQVSQSLMNNSVPDTQLALETLMQAILQLPGYLDRLHRDQKDSERNYLPMVNNLRASRGEERIPGTEGQDDQESSGPDLSPLTDAPTDVVVNAFFQGDGEGNLPKIRARYTTTLAKILKKKDVRENITTLGKLFTMLGRLCGESPMGNLAELGLAVIEGIAGGGVKLGNESVVLLRGIDGQLKRLAEEGQDGLSNPVDTELALGLIELLNNATKQTERIKTVVAKYAGEAREPEEVAIGPDDETLSTVAKILIEELTAVTDKLDLYVRSQNRNADDLVKLIPNLEQIASTMVVLGDPGQQATITEQVGVIKSIEQGAEPDDEVRRIPLPIWMKRRPQ
jgi:chemosensory pili system protein ChpA (sensor histidine kinase/response regulator)